MPIPKVDSKLKLDDQIAFAIRREDKEAFKSVCDAEGIDISSKLRYLIQLYVVEIRRQEALSPSCPLTEVQSR